MRSVRREVETRARVPVRDRVLPTVWFRVWGQAEGQVRRQVWHPVRAEVDHHA